MDRIDVKLLRALISEGAVAPSNPNVKSSLRAIAGRLGADDMTVSYRYKRLQESGCMSGWSLLVNPMFFGYKVIVLMVDVHPESGKSDMIRKLRLIQEITGIVNFYGRGLSIFMIYNGEESRSRTIELISRITNAERITQVRMALPQSETQKLSESDVTIVRSLSKDARKSAVQVSTEIGLSTKTVRKRVERLRRENTIFPFPILNIESIPGFVPIYISYIYSDNRAKASVDQAVVSHFDENFLTGNFSDPNTGHIVLSGSAMADVQKFQEWTKSQAGIASVRLDIPIETLMFPEKLIELLELREKSGLLQANSYSRA